MVLVKPVTSDTASGGEGVQILNGLVGYHVAVRLLPILPKFVHVNHEMVAVVGLEPTMACALRF